MLATALAFSLLALLAVEASRAPVYYGGGLRPAASVRHDRHGVPIRALRTTEADDGRVYYTGPKSRSSYHDEERAARRSGRRHRHRGEEEEEEEEGESEGRERIRTARDVKKLSRRIYEEQQREADKRLGRSSSKRSTRLVPEGAIEKILRLVDLDVADEREGGSRRHRHRHEARPSRRRYDGERLEEGRRGGCRGGRCERGRHERRSRSHASISASESRERERERRKEHRNKADRKSRTIRIKPRKHRHHRHHVTICNRTESSTYAYDVCRNERKKDRRSSSGSVSYSSSASSRSFKKSHRSSRRHRR